MNQYNRSGWLKLSSHTFEHSADTQLGIAADMQLDNRGLAYGDGFFSTMGVYRGHILWQDYHRQRLLSHAHALHLAMDVNAVMEQLAYHAQQITEGMMKVIACRQPQAVAGYGFVNGDCDLWLKQIPMPMPTYQGLSHQQGKSLSITPTAAFVDATVDIEVNTTVNATDYLPNLSIVMAVQKPAAAICLQGRISCQPPALVGLKTLGRLDNVLLSHELACQQIGEAVGQTPEYGLVRDVDGDWVEGISSNVFYQLANNQAGYDQGQWFTPPIDKSGVAGVMRAVMMDNLADSDTPIVERRLQDADLPQLSAMLFTNAVRGLMPVSALILLTGQTLQFN